MVAADGKWLEEKTGEIVKQLVADYRSHSSVADGFKAFRRGILEAKKHCPPANAPWLDTLLEEVEGAIEEKLRKEHYDRVRDVDTV